MDVTIRPVRAEEYEALGEITAQAYLGDGLLDFGTGDPYLEQLRAVGRRAAEALVLAAVDAGGELLGGVTYVAPGSPWADVAGPDEAEFRMLAVSGTARGRGAGEALVRACVDRARAAGGLSGIVLSTRSSMEAAHRIYRRLGFVRTPERDWSPLPGFTLLTFRLPL
ncbi:GNAT family N-acetyltransferase [[Kitasatospora] papulosa]|uniref:GNAT family N-acetyltransferase n=1 Tax=Streptomyces TaxID=1883 RepID=UPI0004C8E770|nr:MULTISPECIES: N-acetyltransferase [Streptomyces]MBD2833775.1 GNAT family N-acetyltransferase [Streptomyces pratensis]TPN26763.1 GNAT family N-acetyltransferase [Mesorhizobium sp. B2-3-3]MCX4412014.1 GNAT family N-acetyltransferase [[Kitasatospora] papulosa]MCY1653579.1 N-acetyltransferase [Streptomyces sp. SL203]MCY1679166.1 N-acetyltransferase [Streptomyces sp. SL294]